VGGLQVAAPHPLRLVLNWGRRYSLWVFNFGLACCAIEFIAASMARHDFIRLGVIPFAHGPRQADLMIVSGTVTDKMAPAVRRLWEQMPEPKYVISFGACSNSGGPYWDSYCVTKGVDQVIPVDVYVPGCPPRPEALLQGIIKLQEKIGDEDLGQRYSPRRSVNAAVATRPLIPAEPAAWVPPEDAPSGQDVNAVAGLAGAARPAGRFPAPRKAASGTPGPEVAEQPTVLEPAAEKPATEPAAAEKPAAEKPAAEKPAAEKAAAEPAAEQPTVEQAVVQQPTLEQPAATAEQTEQTEPEPAGPEQTEPSEPSSEKPPETPPVTPTVQHAVRARDILPPPRRRRR
jgi:NADH-quinone oxidoreductase B subunit